MEYNPLKLEDGSYTIAVKEPMEYQPRILDIKLPNEEIAKQVCIVLEVEYYEGYNTGSGHGYSNGVADCS